MELTRQERAPKSTFWTDDGPRRLRTASLIFAAGFILAWFAAPPEARPHGIFPMFDVATIGAVAASACVFASARFLKSNPARLFDIGLIYEVIFCFAIAISEQWLPWDSSHMPRGISWVCLALVVFPLTVPATPGKALVAALTGASMGPIALTIAVLKGNPFPPVDFVLALFLPSYLAAGGAYLLSRTIYQLGRDVTKARQLGSYELIERLGSGGMGEVWRARHRLLARPAAVKLIRPDLLDAKGANEGEKLRRRFEQEAKATSLLESPHTISIYDYGTANDGTFYYVMELLDGLDLQSLVHRYGRLPPERVIHLLRQACNSLAEAHERGLVHRDIKPANIYICKRGIDLDFVKILDFGLVVTHDDAEHKLARLTQHGMATGTPSYMAPEMAEPSNRVDARADIYALGCVGYWMLTGHLVFEAPSAAELLAEHLHARPKRPSERIGESVPEDLEDLIMSCLEKEPSLRPKSARDLAASLERCMDADEWDAPRRAAWWSARERTHG